MNNKILKTLEFSVIKKSLKIFLFTAMGNKELVKLTPSVNLKKVKILLEQTDEALLILRNKGEIPIKRVTDLSNIFKRLKIKASLSATELVSLKKLIVSSQLIINFFANLKEEAWFNNLKDLISITQNLTNFSVILSQLEKVVDDRGKILDSASKKLEKLRNNEAEIKKKIRTILTSYIKGPENKYLSEKVISTRNGVLVLPVKADFKKHFGGVVHDQSQTGLTLYIEPKQVTSLNETIHKLLREEKNEINSILYKETNKLFPYFKSLKINNKLVGKFDLIQAKAKLARKMDANKPFINKEKQISLKKAYHPILGKGSVANDIKLGKKFTSLIITGPNTGGKTVLMETVGLLQIMAQSGLFITAKEGSYIHVFDNIFADIGDEQSLEQSLSTFSSHLKNIKSITEKANSNSLVLLDEIGAGTDPKEGAALAMATVNFLSQKGILNIITTHYPELKVFADHSNFALNASMEFDSHTLKPTYHLLLGIPGQSNGLTIADKLGINKKILQDASHYLSHKEQNVNDMIKDLVHRRQNLNEKQHYLSEQIEKVKNKKEKLNSNLANLSQEKEDQISKAKKKANQIVSVAKGKSKSLVNDIRKERLKVGSIGKKGKNEQELQETVRKFDQLKQKRNLKNNKVLKKARKKKAFRVGDDVLVTTYNQIGTLIEKISNNQWEVQLGILKMKVPENILEKVPQKQEEKLQKRKKLVNVNIQPRIIKTSSNNISGHIDLRGERYEQAMNDLDRYLDQAVLNNLSTIEVIHGKGTGALRKGVTKMLRSDRRVKSYQFANPNEAGDGATIVKLN